MNQKARKILILGSGALKIGEAGEFDYSGSQAIKALKEEGIKTVLINPNIATIQTSSFLADKIYFLPVTSYFVEKVIQKEKPDGILLSFGGQTALNCGINLYKKGVFKKYNVGILGSPISSIVLTEDRNRFAKHLKKIDIPTPRSETAKTIDQALKIAEEIGFPVMIRSGFALGGLGSGVAKNKEEVKTIVQKALSFAPQILIEQYLHHFKEIEYEVVRDQYDNCITVCNMENMDPLGIHTGDSIVVAPSQTLNNFEYHTLRAAAIKIVRSLKIVGECNVQFALNPNPKLKKTKERGSKFAQDGKRTAGPSKFSYRANEQEMDFYVIEVNARLSRSSALASKATGYPLAYVAAKLALGKNLTQVRNQITKITQACFEPALDYIVVKIPRWDIEKFKGADEKIGSSMKSVGEVMGIGRTFEEAYQKAIRMLDLDFEGAINRKIIRNGKPLQELLSTPTPKRVFALAEGLRKGMGIQKIYGLCGIDPWFLWRIKNIVEHEKKAPKTLEKLSKDNLLKLKQLGFSDKYIGMLCKTTGLTIRSLRKKWGILPSIIQIDTLAGEFEAQTNYLYLTYNTSHDDVKPIKSKGVVVLGSGPYRIGSSVEFDWTSVNTTLQLKKHKKQSIIINCNPETVSTDYDISDRLYFEELTFERIADIYEFEQPLGVIVSVGGQTPNNRARALAEYGFQILGTSSSDIHKAEDRTQFSKLLDTFGISQPPWNKFSSVKSAVAFCNKVGYPVLIRPSYVLSGTSMRICHNESELAYCLKRLSHISKEYPITVSKFIQEAKEIELDAVAKKGVIKAFVISEHIENAGVHSGDATIVLPPQTIDKTVQKRIEEIGKILAKALSITGPFNIQFLVKDMTASVIEINLRSSRTFPFISKVTGVDFIKLYVDAIFDKPVPKTPANSLRFVATKVPQFSFARLTGADPLLHVEMASTGEVACFGNDVEEAFLKGELAVGGTIPKKGIFISLGGNTNKEKFLSSAQKAANLGLPIYATEKTAAFLQNNKIQAKRLYKIYEHKSPNVLEYFQKRKLDLAINLLEESHHKQEVGDEYTIRRAAIDFNIPLFTDLKKAELFIKAIAKKKEENLAIKPWNDYIPKKISL